MVCWKIVAVNVPESVSRNLGDFRVAYMPDVTMEIMNSHAPTKTALPQKHAQGMQNLVSHRAAGEVVVVRLSLDVASEAQQLYLGVQVGMISISWVWVLSAGVVAGIPSHRR